MDNQISVYGEPKRPRTGAVRICAQTKMGYLTPFYEWRTIDPPQRAPELPVGVGEFIGTNDPDPCLNGEVVLREEEIPLPDIETWKIGPPEALRECIPGPRGCVHV